MQRCGRTHARWWGSLPSLSWSRELDGVVPGHDGERIWNTGTGTILQLGACGPGGRIPLGIVACGGEWLGESARCIREVVRSASSSHGVSEISCKWDRDGAGIVRRSLRTNGGDATFRPAPSGSGMAIGEGVSDY